MRNIKWLYIKKHDGFCVHYWYKGKHYYAITDPYCSKMTIHELSQHIHSLLAKTKIDLEYL